MYWPIVSMCHSFSSYNNRCWLYLLPPQCMYGMLSQIKDYQVSLRQKREAYQNGERSLLFNLHERFTLGFLKHTNYRKCLSLRPLHAWLLKEILHKLHWQPTINNSMTPYVLLCIAYQDCFVCLTHSIHNL